MKTILGRLPMVFFALFFLPGFSHADCECGFRCDAPNQNCCVASNFGDLGLSCVTGTCVGQPVTAWATADPGSCPNCVPGPVTWQFTLHQGAVTNPTIASKIGHESSATWDIDTCFLTPDVYFVKIEYLYGQNGCDNGSPACVKNNYFPTNSIGFDLRDKCCEATGSLIVNHPYQCAIKSLRERIIPSGSINKDHVYLPCENSQDRWRMTLVSDLGMVLNAWCQGIPPQCNSVPNGRPIGYGPTVNDPTKFGQFYWIKPEILPPHAYAVQLGYFCCPNDVPPCGLPNHNCGGCPPCDPIPLAQASFTIYYVKYDAISHFFPTSDQNCEGFDEFTTPQDVLLGTHDSGVWAHSKDMKVEILPKTSFAPLSQFNVISSNTSNVEVVPSVPTSNPQLVTLTGASDDEDDNSLVYTLLAVPGVGDQRCSDLSGTVPAEFCVTLKQAQVRYAYVHIVDPVPPSLVNCPAPPAPPPPPYCSSIDLSADTLSEFGLGDVLLQASNILAETSMTYINQPKNSVHLCHHLTSAQADSIGCNVNYKYNPYINQDVKLVANSHITGLSTIDIFYVWELADSDNEDCTDAGPVGAFFSKEWLQRSAKGAVIIDEYSKDEDCTFPGTLEASPDSLAHEIAHEFGFKDCGMGTDEDPACIIDTRNLMWSLANPGCGEPEKCDLMTHQEDTLNDPQRTRCSH